MQKDPWQPPGHKPPGTGMHHVTRSMGNKTDRLGPACMELHGVQNARARARFGCSVLLTCSIKLLDLSYVFWLIHQNISRSPSLKRFLLLGDRQSVGLHRCLCSGYLPSSMC